MHRLALALSSPLFFGCSFIFIHSPPDDHENLRYFDCVSSTAAPTSDVVGAVLFSAATASVATADTVESGGERAPALFFGTLATLHAAAAVYGYLNTSECSSAKQNLAERIHTRELEDARRIQALEDALRAAPQQGCTTDQQCKGDRVCQGGVCSAPPAPAPPATPPLQPGVPQLPASPPPASPPPASPAPPAPSGSGAPAAPELAPP